MTREVTTAELVEMGQVDLGTSPWRRIEQPRVDCFAEATDDHQWIHVDGDRAAGGPFGVTIAHGHLTLSLLPAMLKELITITDQARGTNYGLDKVRFTAPVPVGSDIRLRAAVTGASRRDDGAVRYSVAVTVEVRDQQRPAMVGESIYLTYPVDAPS